MTTLNSNEIVIKKEDLIDAIAGNYDEFGNPYKGLYVDLSGEIECADSSGAEDKVAIMTFSGMGDFTDENGLYNDHEDYNAGGVAEYIVDDGECLKWSGAIMNEDGEEVEYDIVVI